MSRCILIFFLFLGLGKLLAAPLSMDLVVAGGTQTETIRIEGFMDTPAQRGFMPLRVFLRNTADKSGEWRFRFSARDGYDDTNQMASEFRLRVDAGAEQTVEWLVPVYPYRKGNSYRKRLEVSVTGPDGFSISNESLLDDSGSGSGAQSLVGLSESIGLLHREALQTELKDQRRNIPLKLARVDVTMLPENPLGLMGLDVLVMTRDEFGALSQAQRYALRQWLAMGGRLVFPDDREAVVEKVGHGGIHAIPFGKWNPPALIEAFKRIPTLTDRLEADPQQFATFRWPLRESIPDISRPIALLMLFVLLIAFLLGPANLYIAHRKKQPARVLWTTPILSAALSVALIVVIVLSDGFGGKGNRSLTMLLLPDDQVEVIIQEQISRTGVLLSDTFSLPSGVMMTAIDTDFEEGSSRRGRQGGQNKGRYQFAADGSTGGDWFKSRRIQGHILHSSRPTRARIQFFPGAVPEVLSTVDAPLSDLLIRDEKGAYWKTDTLLAGERKPMAPVSTAAAEELLKSLVTRAQGPMVDLIGMGGRKGWFYAKGAEGKGPFIDTLPAIRWKEQPVCWIGPVSAGGQP